MNERPIIFSGESVRAILDGRKTMTRRVVKEGPYGDFWGNPAWSGYPGDLWYVTANLTPPSIFTFKPCPYGKVGDRLWVKESFGYYANGSYFYKADGSELHTKHHSPLFMPREASRITLEITNVSVERLQDISGSNCAAEGIVPNNDPNWHLDLTGGVQTEIRVIREAFAAAWDKINGKKHPWASNPWVWKIEFKVTI